VRSPPRHVRFAATGERIRWLETGCGENRRRRRTSQEESRRGVETGDFYVQWLTLWGLWQCGPRKSSHGSRTHRWTALQSTSAWRGSGWSVLFNGTEMTRADDGARLSSCEMNKESHELMPASMDHWILDWDKILSHVWDQKFRKFKKNRRRPHKTSQFKIKYKCISVLDYCSLLGCVWYNFDSLWADSIRKYFAAESDFFYYFLA
jgi:hypothetical protein